MGIVQHISMIVTGLDFNSKKASKRNILTKSHKVAVKLFGKNLVTKPIKVMNGYSTFVIVPCGSKLGWEESDNFLSQMDKFQQYLDKINHDSTSIGYVRVSNGELGFGAENESGIEISKWEPF